MLPAPGVAESETRLSHEQINIKDVIQQSTSDVPLAELAKKGFRNVKVLNREAINRLIAEAVDRVISERLAEAHELDRAEIEAHSRAKFDKLLGDQKHAAQTVDLYQERIQRLETEVALRDEKINSLQEQLAQAVPAHTPGSAKELQAIQDSIEKLSRRLASGAAAGDGPMDAKEAEFAVRAMLSAVTEGEDAVETNVRDVQVKKSKARGLKSTLDKLKNLQRDKES